MINDIKIYRLENKPDFAKEVSDWIESSWGILPIHDYFKAILGRQKWYLNYPVTLIATSNEKIIGTVSLLLNDLETRPEINPWIGCLFVKEEYRKNGVGSILMNEIEKFFASNFFTETCYLFTEDQDQLYRKLGWSFVEMDTYHGRKIAIMKKDFKPISTSNANSINKEFSELKSDFFDKAPICMWACDEDYKIVLWNSGAEVIYGHTKEEVLGKSYLDIFIDEAEKEQSQKDCDRVIKEGWVQQNCLAYDHDHKSKSRHMLTNVFRIQSPVNSKQYQAEIGIEISDLGEKHEEHRMLREHGIKKISIGSASVDTNKRLLTDQLESLRLQIKLNHKAKTNDITNWQKRFDGITHTERDAYLLEINKICERDNKKISDKISEIQECRNQDQINEIRNELDNFIDKLESFVSGSN